MTIIRHVIKPGHWEILQAWDAIETEHPGISMEQLFARVCNHFKHEIDDADIAAALATLPTDDE